MLASRFGSTLSAMADDTMEISSEHGHNIGDEDIDIDIDFATGHVEEDYMLEDAASNVGFGDEFNHPEPSLVVAHEDLMIDEDDGSYPMPIDGTDATDNMRHVHHHSMDDAALEMSSPPANISAVLIEENHSRDTSQLVGDGSMKDEVSWEANDETDQAINPTDDILDTPDEERRETHQDDTDIPHILDNKEVDTTIVATHQDVRSNTSRDISPKSNTTGEEPRSPPASTSALDLENQDHGSEETPSASSTSHDIVHTIETATSEETTSINPTLQVVVKYRNSEYSLFSKSETDDIDSYFLSDLSIKDKPLSNFFEAIRDIIRDDLNDEDELCISVDDLGLEIEELSSMTEGITIGQIINLREKLLHNDGVESITPLCLVLGTRPNFSIRVANLISGASEGKGLSELVLWEDQSESFDDFAHVTGNGPGEEVEPDDYEADGGFVGTDGEEENRANQQESSDGAFAQEPAADQERSHQAGDTQRADASETVVMNETHTTNNSATPLTITDNSASMPKTSVSGDPEYDEDGDLIDYSDAEEEAQHELRKNVDSPSTKLGTDDSRTYNGTFTGFIPPCLKPNTCFCSKCNDLLLAEYEAINEDLRRRSISRSASDDLLEQAAEVLGPSISGDPDHGTTFDAENGIDYDENDGEDFGQDNEALGHGNSPVAFRGDHTVDLDSHEEEFYIGDGDVGGVNLSEDQDPATEAAHAASQETFDEFDFGDDDDPQQHHKHPMLTIQETLSHDDQNEPAEEHTALLSKENLSTESGLEFADVASSESAASEKTLEAQPGSTDDLTTEFNEEHEDEIDYDDDEEFDMPVVQEPVVKELQAPIGGSGKRQRADDDGASIGSKEAKRPRP